MLVNKDESQKITTIGKESQILKVIKTYLSRLSFYQKPLYAI